MTSPIITQAEEYCAKHTHRLTAPRLEALRIMVAASKPLGAYDILQELGKVLDNPKPPTVYRAIEFWQTHGFIHRIESLNAYVLCDAGHRHHGSQFMICEHCGAVIEAHVCDLPKTLQHGVAQHGFTPSRWNLEIYGLCAPCAREHTAT